MNLHAYISYRHIHTCNRSNGNRTHVIGVRGRRPRPLDYRAATFAEAFVLYHTLLLFATVLPYLRRVAVR